MRPLHRSTVNKRNSASTFKRHARRTKMPNVTAPQRGGWRL